MLLENKKKTLTLVHLSCGRTRDVSPTDITPIKRCRTLDRILGILVSSLHNLLVNIELNIVSLIWMTQVYTLIWLLKPTKLTLPCFTIIGLLCCAFWITKQETFRHLATEDFMKPMNVHFGIVSFF